jgi:hypothetical protein
MIKRLYVLNGGGRDRYFEVNDTKINHQLVKEIIQQSKDEYIVLLENGDCLEIFSKDVIVYKSKTLINKV